MARRDAWSKDAGFTLIEALFAVLLMGVIMAALATVTAQWLPSWDKGIARLQNVTLLDVGLDRLVEDLAAAEVISSGDAKDPPIFEGDTLSVAFVRTTLNPNAAAGLEIVQIAQTTDDRGPVLVRSTVPFVPRLASGAALPPFSNPVAMLRAPFHVIFSYAGPDRAWRDSWRGEPELPRAVRVLVRAGDSSTSLAVSTATLIHAELPASCAWAKTQNDCPALKRLGVSAAPAPGAPTGPPTGLQ
jgi:general secretion pathway protein J